MEHLHCDDCYPVGDVPSLQSCASSMRLVILMERSIYVLCVVHSRRLTPDRDCAR